MLGVFALSLKILTPLVVQTQQGELSIFMVVLQSKQIEYEIPNDDHLLLLGDPHQQFATLLLASSNERPDGKLHLDSIEGQGQSYVIQLVYFYRVLAFYFLVLHFALGLSQIVVDQRIHQLFVINRGKEEFAAENAELRMGPGQAQLYLMLPRPLEHSAGPTPTHSAACQVSYLDLADLEDIALFIAVFVILSLRLVLEPNDWVQILDAVSRILRTVFAGVVHCDIFAVVFHENDAFSKQLLLAQQVYAPYFCQFLLHFLCQHSRYCDILVGFSSPHLQLNGLPSLQHLVRLYTILLSLYFFAVRL